MMTMMWFLAAVAAASGAFQPADSDALFDAVGDKCANLEASETEHGLIATWNVSQVTNMKELFQHCKEFNSPLAGWDTSKVTNMAYMFFSAEVFNQPLDFNTSLVTNMQSFFGNNKVYDQTLAFDTSLVTKCTGFCDYCPLPSFSICSPCEFEEKPTGSEKGEVCESEDPPSPAAAAEFSGATATTGFATTTALFVMAVFIM